MSQFPKLAHNEGHVCRIESKQAPAIVLGHIAHKRLDAVFGNLGHSDVFQIKDGSPRLDHTWDHSVSDRVLKEEVCDSNQPVDRDSGIDHATNVDDDDGSHVDVATHAIDHAELEILLVGVKVEIDCLPPLVVLDDLIVGLLVVPFEALEETQHKAVLIIVTLG